MLLIVQAAVFHVAANISVLGGFPQEHHVSHGEAVGFPLCETNEIIVTRSRPNSRHVRRAILNADSENIDCLERELAGRLMYLRACLHRIAQHSGTVVVRFFPKEIKMLTEPGWKKCLSVFSEGVRCGLVPNARFVLHLGQTGDVQCNDAWPWNDGSISDLAGQ